MIVFSNVTNIIKKNTSETFKLLWQFKWSIGAYLLFFCMFMAGYINPPEKNSPIWGSEATEGAWSYINQEVYLGSMRDDLIKLFLLFLVGTSNMRNHPLFAKLTFLSPWICVLLGVLIITYKWLLDLMI